ncbi:MAG: orotidine 5-phosphate decarboxylase [Candidatus Saccharibacteria bacterium]|nr:orotidine 5-phosphate decarboxylase [Candidatus Saccharibacteria bacterium]
MQPKDRIFVSIDVTTIDDAEKLMDQFVGEVGNIKFGLQLATNASWAEGIQIAKSRGFKVFCDAKFKDIPNTVEEAAYSLTLHEPDYFTVMADNSFEALQAIKRGVDRAVMDKSVSRPKIVGVTVLTSISPEECMQIYGADPKTRTIQFAETAAKAGFDAIVCSPEEVADLRKNEKLKDLLLITPGVRPKWAASNEQQRVATPMEAIERGADMLVIGRPITSPPSEIGSPKEALKSIIKEIEEM